MNLKDLVTFASAQAEKIFRQTGVLLPMYHAFKSNGDQFVIASPDIHDKDVAVGIVKAKFDTEDVESYVFMSEAWVLEQAAVGGPEIERAMQHGLSEHPDRREVIAFSAENRDGQMQTARRYILRPEHGKAKLTPLKLDDMVSITESRGRMVGLLRGKR